VYTTNDNTNEFVLSVLVNLVDLVGSYRGQTRKINTAFDTFDDLESEASEHGPTRRMNTIFVTFEDLKSEAISINKSLLVLNQLLRSLSSGKTRKQIPPFRESNLTHFLKNSLEGNTFTVMIVNVNPSPKDYGETLNSLGFALAANRIHNTISQNAKETFLQDVVEGVFCFDGRAGNLEQDLRQQAPDIREFRVSNLGINSLEKYMLEISSS